MGLSLWVAASCVLAVYNKQVTAAEAFQPCSSEAEVSLQAGETIYITSPNYPEPYPSNFQCGWVITSADPNNQLYLGCTHFRLQGKSKSGCLDYLSVNGDEYCGRQKPSGSASELILEFKSNRRREREGFNCTVSAFSAAQGTEGQDCAEMIDPVLVGLGESVTFSSPNYAANPNVTRFCWKFEQATTGMQLSLSCTHFQLRRPNKRNKCRDAFIIKGHGKYCGTEAPSITSGSGSLPVKVVARRMGREPSFSCVVAGELLSSTEAPLPTISLLVSSPSPPTEAAPDCGLKYETDTRIVGGVTANANEYPWQVGLVQAASPSEVFCGGSVIAHQWILTAAHCAESIEGRESHHKVLVGAHDLRYQTPSQQLLSIRKTIIHPDYDYESVDNDVALLQVEYIAFSARVGPVCLPEPSSSYGGRLATVTGWGALSSGGVTSNVLMEVQVPTLTERECKESYNSYVTQNMFCAGLPEGGKDSCQGDSGGPMVTPRDNDPQRYEQIGIVSWGIGCAEPGNPWSLHERCKLHSLDSGNDATAVIALQPA
ncbi:venom serine protease 34-like [Penaeus monodon]|uniref:venom serine protease 34-like n=1 Tax=Penaeus monodon TaxID=6687 RepID=UPI0018A6DA82|nr:venom serine protease 34-like [Penaeus monodon]